ncbi:MAG: polyprenyl synthetase family protein [Verrucomicrobiota bacterium]|nr:polyprenyl synthetase family protein [Verrucomicrobiota bacterium]
MLLEKYQEQFEKKLRSFVQELGDASPLHEACSYALLSQGKRLRPLLVVSIAEALGYGLDVTPAALSVECFHTASLIADDLPSMDDDDFRRNRPSLHKQFGESTALLASYTLIAEGYGGISRNEELMRQKCPQKASQAAFLALQTATRCGGLQGATYGQYLDLFPPDISWKTASQIIAQKTISLFQLSFVFGWLFGGGDANQLEVVEKCAWHFGMAFQLADDWEDELQDKKREQTVNAINLLGREETERLFQKELDGLENSLKVLGLWIQPLQEICCILRSKTAPLRAL